MDGLLDPFRRLLDDVCPSATVRAIEGGADWRPAWETIAASGFLDVLVPEAAGGAGLSLADAAPLLAAIGGQAAPLPIGETMIARALLGDTAPDGPIVIVTGAWPTPLAEPWAHVVTDAALRPIAAVLRAQLIAGAASRVLDMTVGYANERHQFGRPIGRQQAVQQQLAVLAEQAVAARIAAAIGARAGLRPDPVQAGIAKHGASVAAGMIAGIAHAVHAAIGISAEYDLQLLTRRLHEWRLADGSAPYWAGVVGSARAAAPGTTLACLMRPRPPAPDAADAAARD